MNKIQMVQQEMMQALKNKDTERKDALSMLLSALKAKAKDKRADLTEEEEDTIILKEIKQTKETLESAPADRGDIRKQCEFRISVLSEFAPKRMEEDEIKQVIQTVLDQLGIQTPSAKDKGMIMKNLMPLVKGKADGSLVNKLLSERLQ